MKPSTAILYIMVTLSLVFSLTALIIVAGNNNILAPSNPSNTPKPTNAQTTVPSLTPLPSFTNPPESTPIPVGVSYGSDFTLSYETAKRQDLNGSTEVTLTVYIEYHGTNDSIINYSQFHLFTYTSRVGIPFNRATTNPLNSGSITLGATHPHGTIQVTFQFPTQQFNGMDIANTGYKLQFEEAA